MGGDEHEMGSFYDSADKLGSCAAGIGPVLQVCG
jgi:hypothetical protein